MMRYLLAVLASAAAWGQSTPGYGGLANRYAPTAQAVQTSQATAQFWMTNGDDVTFGNVDFEVCSWASPSAAMLASNGEFMRLSGNTWGWGLSYYSALGSHPWVFSINNLSPFVSASNVGPAVAGSWHLVCGEHDSVAGTIGISVDAKTLVTTSRATPPTAGTGGVYVGLGGGGNWDGAVARAGIWSRKLTAAERTALYNSGIGLRGGDLSGSLATGLLHYWDLDGPADLPQRDLAAKSPLETSNAFYPGAGAVANGKTSLFPAGSSPRIAYMPLHIAGGDYLQYEVSWGKKSPKELIVSGDSLLNGIFNSLNTTQSAAMQLAAMIGPAWHVNVTAVPGYKTTDDIAGLSTPENTMCGEPYQRRVWAIEIGANDLMANVPVGPDTTPGSVEFNIRQMAAARKAAGCTTAVLTLTPCLHAMCTSANNYDGNRGALNAWLRSGASGADYVIDVASAPVLGDPNNTAYYQDKLHYNPAGAWVVATYLAAFLATL
jgi:hypothetical protein